MNIIVCSQPDLFLLKKFIQIYSEIYILKPMGSGGCFGPTKKKKQIYAKMIQEMFEEGTRIQYQENIDEIIKSIKQRINKKGYLRKFVDNLSSHRYKIPETMDLNINYTTHSKSLCGYSTGLIIADSILDIVYPQKGKWEESENGIEQEIKDPFTTSTRSIQKPLASSSKKKIINYMPERELNYMEQNKSIYDQLYLRLVLHLLEVQKKIHKICIKSLLSFCNRHVGILTCELYIWRILNILAQSLKYKMLTSQICELFYLILGKTKDIRFDDQKSRDLLKVMMTLWLNQHQTKSNYQIRDNSFKVIKIYFNRCISSWASHILYQTIFLIYDELQFDSLKTSILEKMFEDILESQDLKHGYLRGIFNYLLGYLSLTYSFSSEENNKWMTTSLGLNYQKMRERYKNFSKERVKIQCFKLLNSWINKKYADLNEFCIYNTKAIVFLYLSNTKSFFSNIQFLSILTEQYFQIIQHLNIESRRLFLAKLIEDFRDQQLSQVQHELIMRLIKETAQKNLLNTTPCSNETQISNFEEKSPQKLSLELVRSQSQSSQLQSQLQKKSLLELFLCPVLANYSDSLKLQQLKFICSVINREESLFLSQDGKYRLVQLLYSIYEILFYDEQSIEFKIQFKCAAISILRALTSKYYSILESNSISQDAFTDILNINIPLLFKIYTLQVGDQICKTVSEQVTPYLRLVIFHFLLQMKLMLQRSASTETLAILSEIQSIITNSTPDIQITADMRIESEQINQFLHKRSKQIQKELLKLKNLKAQQKTQQDEYFALFSKLFNLQVRITFVNKKGRTTTGISQKEVSNYSGSVKNSLKIARCEKCNNGKQCLNCKNKFRCDQSFEDVMSIVHI